MDSDDPKKPEFSSTDSYRHFARRVRHRRRYILGKRDQAFLDTILATLKGRDVEIPKNTILYRAQIGVRYDDEYGIIPSGFNAQRMKPLADKAREGRVNPAGIPVLYLATTEQTAISEVKPWIGSELSVAQFKIVRKLKAVNLFLRYGEMRPGNILFSLDLGWVKAKSKPEEKEKAVWIDIDNAFSRPVTLPDDAAEYVPTQILSELFRSKGYDAVAYRSQFGEDGYNLALFDVRDADAVNCAPYTVTGIDIKFEVMGNRWFSKKKKSDSC